MKMYFWWIESVLVTVTDIATGMVRDRHKYAFNPLKIPLDFSLPVLPSHQIP
jgi:hypothetical protein